MNIQAISDLHGFLPMIPPCDLLLIAGDVCPYHNHNLSFQRDWLNVQFRQWLLAQPARKIVGVWGNHDLIAEQRPEAVPPLPWTVLTDELLVWEGLRIYGLPWQQRFYDWAFNLDEPQLSEKYDAIPACDIIVSHGPPLNVGDRTDNGDHVGSAAFSDAIVNSGAQLAVFGHIHEGRGARIDRIGLTTVTRANVTHVNAKYQPVHPPMEFSLAV